MENLGKDDIVRIDRLIDRLNRVIEARPMVFYTGTVRAGAKRRAFSIESKKVNAFSKVVEAEEEDIQYLISQGAAHASTRKEMREYFGMLLTDMDDIYHELASAMTQRLSTGEDDRKVMERLQHVQESYHALKRYVETDTGLYVWMHPVVRRLCDMAFVPEKIKEQENTFECSITRFYPDGYYDFWKIDDKLALEQKAGTSVNLTSLLTEESFVSLGQDIDPDDVRKQLKYPLVKAISQYPLSTDKIVGTVNTITKRFLVRYHAEVHDIEVQEEEAGKTMVVNRGVQEARPLFLQKYRGKGKFTLEFRRITSGGSFYSVNTDKDSGRACLESTIRS
ncbi:hypothetical protein GF351_03280 [Candidatus Woesearchaeota archaeon]|nr:hypothetical protein [Candidatus Woesearchaeota archaeon]